jgi:hypothetical protein
MNSPNNFIKVILVKYYQGETSLEEENILKKYFASELVSEEFSVDKELFVALDSNSEDIFVVNTELELTVAIGKAKEINSGRAKVLRPLITWTAAASVVILVGLGLFLGQKSEDYVFSDTFDDPYLAMQETQRVLALLGSKMQIAKAGIEPLEKLNEVTRIIEPITKISKRLEYLNWFDIIDNSNEFSIANNKVYEDENQ